MSKIDHLAFPPALMLAGVNRQIAISDGSKLAVPRDAAPVICDQCEAPMERIATMPMSGLRPAIEIFRCRPCSTVMSREPS